MATMLPMPPASQDNCPLQCGAQARFVEVPERETFIITCPECRKFRITSAAIEYIAFELDKSRLPLVRRATREAVEPLLITEISILEIAVDQGCREQERG